MKSDQSVSRGATLVELLVAIVILAVGLLPLLLAMNNVYVNTVRIGSRIEAQHLAAARLDELKAMGFKAIEMNLLAGQASVTIDEGALAVKPYRRGTTIVHQRKVTDAQFVDAVLANLPTDYIRLTTTVTWGTDTGTQKRSLTALVTRDGALE
jgi:prepilin-type N-terminal cleavage/methylation domain-containing protein